MLHLPVPFWRIQPISYPEKLQVSLSTMWMCSTSPGGPWKWKRLGSSGCFPRNTSGISSSLCSPRLQILSYFYCSVLEHLYSPGFLFTTSCSPMLLCLSALILFRDSLQQHICHCFWNIFSQVDPRLKGETWRRTNIFPSEKPSQIKFPSPKINTLGFYCVHILAMLWFIRKSSASVMQPQEGARNTRRLHSLTADTFGGAFREAKRRKWRSSFLCMEASAGSKGNWQEADL